MPHAKSLRAIGQYLETLPIQALLRFTKLNVFLSYIFHRRRTVFSDAVLACFLERIGKSAIGICFAASPSMSQVVRILHGRKPLQRRSDGSLALDRDYLFRI